MNREELQSRRAEAYKKYRTEIMGIEAEYAKANNTVSVGDFVVDHIGTVLVEEILIDGGDEPRCVYRGPEYTKAGKPKKNGSKRDVWQSNLVI